MSLVPNLIIFDDPCRTDLLPLTFTRPLADIRIGILTIREKWEIRFKLKSFSLTESYLSEKFPLETKDDNYLVNGSVCPTDNLVDTIHDLKYGHSIWQGDTLIGARLSGSQINVENIEITKDEYAREIDQPINKVNKLWDIFADNEREMLADFRLITTGRGSNTLHSSNRVIGDHPIFVEEGAKIFCSNFNTENGPIYIGYDAEIMEGCQVRGPFALCKSAVLKMGAKMYGPTTIGPYSKVGGEINNSVIFGYSNKAHDGFLGNSVIGEWCNLGADTNNSNLKNNYGHVKLWNYNAGNYENTGRQFCGLIMGDHSKTAINTMFNTGTVVGVSANIFGAGFPDTHIPSFTWGGIEGYKTYSPGVALKVAEKVLDRRMLKLHEADKAIFESIFSQTKRFRFWEEKEKIAGQTG